MDIRATVNMTFVPTQAEGRIVYIAVFDGTDKLGRVVSTPSPASRSVYSAPKHVISDFEPIDV